MQLNDDGFIKCEAIINKWVNPIYGRCYLIGKNLKKAIKDKRVIKIRCPNAEPGMIAMKRDGKWLCRSCLLKWEKKNHPWEHPQPTRARLRKPRIYKQRMPQTKKARLVPRTDNDNKSIT